MQPKDSLCLLCLLELKGLPQQQVLDSKRTSNVSYHSLWLWRKIHQWKPRRTKAPVVEPFSWLLLIMLTTLFSKLSTKQLPRISFSWEERLKEIQTILTWNWIAWQTPEQRKSMKSKCKARNSNLRIPILVLFSTPRKRRLRLERMALLSLNLQTKSSSSKLLIKRKH